MHIAETRQHLGQRSRPADRFRPSWGETKPGRTRGKRSIPVLLSPPPTTSARDNLSDSLPCPAERTWPMDRKPQALRGTLSRRGVSKFCFEVRYDYKNNLWLSRRASRLVPPEPGN